MFISLFSLSIFYLISAAVRTAQTSLLEHTATQTCMHAHRQTHYTTAFKLTGTPAKMVRSTCPANCVGVLWHCKPCMRAWCPGMQRDLSQTCLHRCVLCCVVLRCGSHSYRQMRIKVVPFWCQSIVNRCTGLTQICQLCLQMKHASLCLSQLLAVVETQRYLQEPTRSMGGPSGENHLKSLSRRRKCLAFCYCV